MDTDERTTRSSKSTDPAKRAGAESRAPGMAQTPGHDGASASTATRRTTSTPSIKQYDEFDLNYNEKFGKPGQCDHGRRLRGARLLITKPEFDEEVEWTWYYLWHHEGRRARHGASMMAPDYAHWHGMFEVAERFYMELIPQAREAATTPASSAANRRAPQPSTR